MRSELEMAVGHVEPQKVYLEPGAEPVGLEAAYLESGAGPVGLEATVPRDVVWLKGC